MFFFLDVRCADVLQGFNIAVCEVSIAELADFRRTCICAKSADVVLVD